MKDFTFAVIIGLVTSLAALIGLTASHLVTDAGALIAALSAGSYLAVHSYRYVTSH